MYSRLYLFLTKYKILFGKHFGFRNKHSTIHALISLVDLIKKHLDNTNLFVEFLLTFKRHLIPLIMISSWPNFLIMARGLANNWLSSFLQNRTQYVYLDGHCSITKQVTCGVPQGSTLSPLLFLVYIDNLQSAFSKSIVYHFADDTNLQFPAKNIGTIESVVNNELKLLSQSLRSMKLKSLNETKTELIIFRSPLKTFYHENQTSK